MNRRGKAPYQFASAIAALLCILPCMYTVHAWAQSADTSTADLLPNFDPLLIPDSLDGLSKFLPEFHHEPYESAGFFPLALPFRYEDPAGLGDRSEADALAFLINQDLDWGPGNYSARHAYFVFAWSAKEMWPLRKTYSAPAIAQLVKFWTATHAVGGVLRRTAAGCSGTLEIYDGNGQVVFTKDYADPRDYFKLLGDMDVDALTFFCRKPPSAALADFLHQSRCQHPESIIKLGLQAFHSRHESLPKYVEILDEDPTFSEVRSWWANQNAWTNGDLSEPQREKVMALKNRLVPMALDDFEPERCRDQALVQSFKECVKAAFELAGNDSSIAVTARLDAIEGSGEYDRLLIHHALKMAEENPNDGQLMLPLTQVLLANSDGPLDAPLAASLAWTHEKSFYMPGVGDQRGALLQLAEALEFCGRPDYAITALRMSKEKSLLLNSHLMLDLIEAGHWQEAADVYKAAGQIPHDQAGTNLAILALFADVLLDDQKGTNQLRQDWSNEFDGEGISEAVQAYLDARQMKDFSISYTVVLKAHSQGAQLAVLMFGALSDIAAHRQEFFSDVMSYISLSDPSARILWPLIEAYSREGSPFALGGVYATFAWMYPDDPWAAKTLSDWVHHKRRTRPDSPISLPDAYAKYSKLLAKYDPVEVPVWHKHNAGVITNDSSLRAFAFAETIHELLKNGDGDKARELALRYQNLAVQSGIPGLRVWAARLVREAES